MWCHASDMKIIKIILVIIYLHLNCYDNVGRKYYGAILDFILTHNWIAAFQSTNNSQHDLSGFKGDMWLKNELDCQNQKEKLQNNWVFIQRLQETIFPNKTNVKSDKHFKA